MKTFDDLKTEIAARKQEVTARIEWVAPIDHGFGISEAMRVLEEVHENLSDDGDAKVVMMFEGEEYQL